MCGIVAALAQRDVTPILVEGLHRLEYRGYDSAGVAVLVDGQIGRHRVKGKVIGLEEALAKQPLAGHVGIAHTRWATHGEPSERNAHPHLSGDSVAIVHNGIIENHEELRESLRAKGYEFTSDTDTEVMVHMIHDELKHTDDLAEAVRATVAQLRGAYAIAVLHTAEPKRIVAVRKGSPLLLGVGVGEYFLASDASALIPVTQRFVYLKEDDLIDIGADGYQIEDGSGQVVEREIKESELSLDSVSKGRYKHYMAKEIFEQPSAIRNTLMGKVTDAELLYDSFGSIDQNMLKKVEHVHIVACGTSSYAGMVARYWLEQIADVSCSVEIASEYRYRKVSVPANTLYVTISQSGETADSLAALEITKEHGYLGSLVVCNVPESSMVRMADATALTQAGVEIGVASTKAFTTQLAVLLMVTIAIAKARGMSKEDESDAIHALNAVPVLMDKMLELSEEIEKVAENFIEKHHAIFLGRGALYPIAMEGALKLKEISYIHAEGYAAGELKHGPLALIDSDMPVVAVAPNDALLEKLKSNLEEVRTRGGQLYVLAEEGSEISESDNIHVLRVPHSPELVAPIVLSLPMQLLAYHVAVMRGTDVDQPRNLAKSVTVE